VSAVAAAHTRPVLASRPDEGVRESTRPRWWCVPVPAGSAYAAETAHCAIDSAFVARGALAFDLTNEPDAASC
jgi:hypothetical protein